MGTESVRRRIEEASFALRVGDPDRALAAADAAAAADSASAEAQQLRGISLTRLGKLEEATTAFRQATTLAPTEPKHFYNLAVNLRDRKRPDDARRAVDQALRIDPDHAGARSLLIELGGRPSDFVDSEPMAGRPAEPRAGYREQRHILPFMNGIERAWTVVGASFLAADALLAVLMLVHLPMGPTGVMSPNSKLPDVQLKHDPLSIFVVFLYIVTWVCTFMWMFIDVIDLRRRFSWFVPFLACSVLGFTVVPMALYMFLGRRIEPPDPT